MSDIATVQDKAQQKPSSTTMSLASLMHNHRALTKMLEQHTNVLVTFTQVLGEKGRKVTILNPTSYDSLIKMYHKASNYEATSIDKVRIDGFNDVFVTDTK